MSKNIIAEYLKHIKKPAKPEVSEPALRIGELLKTELAKNPKFYFFSPDETTSNKLTAVFDAEKRAWNLPKEAWDLPEDENGHIIEMLSENVLFSVMTGHLMNNEPAMMASYESFYNVITSQLLQQIKFIKQADQVSWRPKYPAINLLSTSTCWRQDHNGFTHQSPALISTLLSLPSNLVNCLFPADDEAAEVIFHYMMQAKNVVNLTTFNKNSGTRFMTKELAEQQTQQNGVIVLDDFSDAEPDIVMVAVGDSMTKEMVEAVKIIKEDLPKVKIRLVNVAALSYRAIGLNNDKLSKLKFAEIFTNDKPIIANFHGYPETLENILENYTHRGRLRVHGFNEEGSTTTPFEMLRRNAASRYDVAIDVAGLYQRQDLIKKYQDMLQQNHEYAVKTGEDLIK